MQIPIIIFYHCLYQIDGRILPDAVGILTEQMKAFEESGLLNAASEFHVGINGSHESEVLANSLPGKSKITYHGLQCKNELRTVLMLEDRVKKLTDQAYILYAHQKGVSHDAASEYGRFSARWRRCMMKTCITRWRECVAELDNGHEAVGAHWLTGMGWDKSQHYFAGTTYWVTGNFMKTVPSILERERLKVSGIDSAESRYESEIIIGNGARLPKIKDMETSHGFSACP